MCPVQEFIVKSSYPGPGNKLQLTAEFTSVENTHNIHRLDTEQNNCLSIVQQVIPPFDPKTSTENRNNAELVIDFFQFRFCANKYKRFEAEMCFTAE